MVQFCQVYNMTSLNPYLYELIFHALATDGLHMIYACPVLKRKECHIDSETRVNHFIA